MTSSAPTGFTVDDFTVDEHAGTVGCPADHTRPISRSRVASFGALCRGCPLRQRCTTSKTGRQIALHRRDDLLRAARRDWAPRTAREVPQGPAQRRTNDLPDRQPRRSTPSNSATAAQKNNAWLTRRTAGLNLRNLIGRGLTRTAGHWAL